MCEMWDLSGPTFENNVSAQPIGKKHLIDLFCFVLSCPSFCMFCFLFTLQCYSKIITSLVHNLQKKQNGIVLDLQVANRAVRPKALQSYTIISQIAIFTFLFLFIYFGYFCFYFVLFLIFLFLLLSSFFIFIFIYFILFLQKPSHLRRTV